MENRNALMCIRAIALSLLCGTAIGTVSTAASAAPQYTYTTIARSEPSPVPDAFAFVGGQAAINDKGLVAFIGSDFCNGPGTCSGVYSYAPTGVLTRIINGGGAASPGHPIQQFSEPSINQSGAISFAVQNVESGGVRSTNWLDVWKKGLVKQVGPTVSNSVMTYATPRIMNNAKVLFSASDTHALATVQNNKAPKPVAPGYCSATDGTGSALNGLVAVVGGPLTGGVCNTTGIIETSIPTGATQVRVADDGSYGTIVSVTINQKGTIVFGGRLLPGRATHVDGLFIQNPGQAPQKIAEIDNGQCTATQPAPGAPCVYRTYDNRGVINVKGQTLSNIRIYDWNTIPQGGPVPTIYGVVLNGDVENGQIAWPGMVIDGCTIRSAVVGSRSLNKNGQIALSLTCDLGGGKTNTAVVVATPVK